MSKPHDDLKIKPNKRPTSEVLKGKALNKAKMLCRKIKNGTATDDDLSEVVKLLRIVDKPPKPGTPTYAKMMQLKTLVEGKLREDKQAALEAENTDPGAPGYLH